MPVHNQIFVPASVLAGSVYGPHVDGELSSRPSGKSLTGADLQLWYLILDAAENAEDVIVDLPQTAITHLLERENPDRIRAGLTRLQGTTMTLSNGTITPTVVSFEHLGHGTEPRIWRIEINRRVHELVQASIRSRQQVNVSAIELREMSSRYSFGIYSRWCGWLKGELPSDRSIVMGRRPGKQAFELDVPLEKVGRVFGVTDRLRPSEIERLLVTRSDKCPLQRELLRAGVDIDTHLMVSEATDRPRSLRILISSFAVKDVSHLRARKKHDENDFAVRRARYEGERSTK